MSEQQNHAGANQYSISYLILLTTIFAIAIVLQSPSRPPAATAQDNSYLFWKCLLAVGVTAEIVASFRIRWTVSHPNSILGVVILCNGVGELLNALLPFGRAQDDLRILEVLLPGATAIAAVPLVLVGLLLLQNRRANAAAVAWACLMLAVVVNQWANTSPAASMKMYVLSLFASYAFFIVFGIVLAYSTFCEFNRPDKPRLAIAIGGAIVHSLSIRALQNS